MMKTNVYKLIPISLGLILSGCMGIYEEGFECPPGEGTKCKSISDVNDMVNNGEIPKKVLIEASFEGSQCLEGSNCSLDSSTLNVPPPESAIWYAPHAIEGSI